ncbi:MAG TPA: helix-turn-helix domain-containing protein [Pirellulales bacterium]|nr:helix-turn-helix domain-containing protein [Pirellulales bacterium]
MRKTEPKTLAQYLKWLQATFDDMEIYTRHAEPDFFEQLQIGETVEQACRLTCRLGGGHLIGKERGVMTPREALVILGRLLAWAREQSSQPAALLSAEEVGRLLGISTRTVWRMLSAGEIPPPIKIGGLTKWRREEIQAMIDLAEASKR